MKGRWANSESIADFEKMAIRSADKQKRMHCFSSYRSTYIIQNLLHLLGLIDLLAETGLFLHPKSIEYFHLTMFRLVKHSDVPFSFLQFFDNKKTVCAWASALSFAAI